MNKKRADELITLLDLAPHPEGGYCREIHQSKSKVISSSSIVRGHADAESSASRNAITVIYFLLMEGQHSRWHQVDADEIWHHCEGDPLELIWFMPGESNYERQTLGPLSARSVPVQAVPAGAWQAAHPLGAYTLASCTVAPGFDFKGFRLLAQAPDEARFLRTQWPELAEFL